MFAIKNLAVSFVFLVLVVTGSSGETENGEASRQTYRELLPSRYQMETRSVHEPISDHVGDTSHRVSIRSVDDAPQSIDLNWNNVVDVILRDAKKEILRQNLDEIPLPEVVEEFKRKWGFILIDARFIANRGWLKSFSSIERNGNASVVVQGQVYTLTCDISMKTAKIRYEHYEIEAWQQSIFSGEIRGNIGSNRLRVVLNFEMKDGECLSTLREVKVLEIGGFEIEVTGLGGSLDDLASMISSWWSKKRVGQITKEIEYYLSKEIRKSLEDFYCDEYASLLMLSL